MAGPPAPIGTLSQHAAAAADLVRGMVPNVFNRMGAKQTRKRDERVQSETDSDSDSDSDSSVSSDASESENQEDTGDWAGKMRASRAAAAPSTAAKSTRTKSAGPASPKVKAKSPANKRALAKHESESSSESESDSASASGNDNENDSASDEGDKMAVDSSPAAKGKAPQTKKDIIEESSESESSENESASDTGAKIAAKAGAGSEESSSSEESASEGSGESESESDGEDRPQRPQQSKPEPVKSSKGAKEAAKVKSSTPAKPARASPATNGARSKETVSESDSSSAESDAESEGHDAESMAVAKAKGKTAVRTPPEIVAQGFHLRKAEEDADAAAVARAFKKAKAEGKQVWYFTTPKSVPIEVIYKQAIPLERIHAAKSIFSHGGAEYTGHFEESVNHTIKVLIPGETGANYTTLKQPVDRVLHITRVAGVSEQQESEVAPTSAAAQPRPQPEGLRPRYQPFGVTKSSPGGVGLDTPDTGDVEMTQAPPLSAGSSAKSGTPKKAAKKRKHGDVEKTTPSTEEAATPLKKPKKAKVDRVSKQAAEPVPAQSSTKKSKRKDKSKKKGSASDRPEEQKIPVKGTPAKVTPILPPPVPGMKST